MTPDVACRILGVSESAPLDVARRAYKRLAHSAHPDRGGSTARFVELTEAWDTFQAMRTRPKKSPSASAPSSSSAPIHFGLGSAMQVVALRVASVRLPVEGTASLAESEEEDGLLLDATLQTSVSVALAQGQRVIVETTYEGFPIVFEGSMMQAAYDDMRGRALSWIRLGALARIV